MNATPSEFAEAIKKPGIFILDVRPAADFEKTHIPGAFNIDVTEEDFIPQVEKNIPKDKTVAVYCNTGKRSALATQQLEKLGYNVINLENGITSWIAAKYPTT